MDESRGERIKTEHAFHVGERKEHQRRALARVAKTLTAGAIAFTTWATVGNAIEQGEKDRYHPESYNTGTFQVEKSEYLNVRTSPIVITNKNEVPNTVDWDQIKEINGENVEGSKSFTIEMPLITYGDDPESIGTEKGPWLTFEAKVGNENETLYVYDGPATDQYVHTIESGTFVKLDSITPPDDLGKVSVNP